jgi:3-methyladenine DNA glycosylase/8-oxoguanine DNA glycosylase
MNLRKVKTVELEPTVPFHFDATFHKPDHFTSGDNHWEPGIRWQTWAWSGQCFGLKFQDRGSLEAPGLQVDIYAARKSSEAVIASLVQEVQYRYNLELDLSGFYEQFVRDRVLGPIIERWRGMRPGHPSSLYEYLIIGIVLQNATVRRSMQMFQALLEHYGTLLEYDSRQLWCFWEPGALREVGEEELRALKVGYRAKSIKRLDECFLHGVVNEFELRKKDRDTQMQELLKLYGIGPATVWYLLFDVFHHWDFFNHISPWEQKIYSKLFFDQDPEHPVEIGKILEHFERFGRYKQLAVHYVWEDLWWQRKKGRTPWLEKLIRV